MQTQKALEQVREKLSGIGDLYNRLILLVGRSGSGKTEVLRAMATQEQRPLINVGADLSLRLLDLTERQRILQLPRLLEETVAGRVAEMAILDNTEVLFSPALKQDPLRLLQGLSRNRTIIASWLGVLEGGRLIYAVPEHPEFRRYSVEDLVVVEIGELGSLASEGKER